MSEQEPSNIEDVLNYMGVDHGTGREIAYQHWFRLLHLIRSHDGIDEEKLVSLARSFVNVDERYIRQYLKSCRVWGVIRTEAGKVYYVGLPKGVAVEKGKPFLAYGPPPEREEQAIVGGENEA